MVIAIPISIMVISGVFFDCEQDTDANINCTHYSSIVMNRDRFNDSYSLPFSAQTQRKGSNIEILASIKNFG